VLSFFHHALRITIYIGRWKLLKKVEFYGAGFPYIHADNLPGKLIVLEGTDGVGRSTQIELLKQWLEIEGFGVSDTGLARSPLTQPGLDAAKAGHTLGRLTMNLFYATDFADRLENHIIPALSAGFCVLSDRYFYSLIARNVVRGADHEWARKVYGFALKPDIVFYLKANVPTLVKRVLKGRGFDYWESGMDVHFADNLYDSFVKYQTQLIRQFDLMSKEFGFTVINANRSAQEVFEDLKEHTKILLNNH
jgi:dTMP kinase